MPELSFKNFATDQEVRWCPGCGDYSILKAVQRSLAEAGAKPENTVFVSGIGCASRLPYYIESYGFHTIHGRAPAIATGVKLANPKLDVWVITGDGDGLSIGGNHLLHALRRNIDVNILLINNEIYGLTKGQYSPTSRVGTTSPSSPGGSVDSPIDPGRFAIGAGATFFGRAVDIDQKGLPGLLNEARGHEGTSFIEILQNCIVYNKDVFDDVANKKTAADHQIHVQHGEPLLFGKTNDKGLRLNPSTLALEAVMVGHDGVTTRDILVHDETNATFAHLLLSMEAPLPTAMGVIHRRRLESFDRAFWNSKTQKRRQKVVNLLHQGNLLDRRNGSE
ncbi:MAG: 2-oxoacid:ferredoxin oxidoreductase subunit beta [Gammaproteobacteria bacterium]|nr:2-oxoacid:ferredoxin oxidoreductase subunit beta [Gammaproteobacteria bacterium]